jgi:hypothetical protein
MIATLNFSLNNLFSRNFYIFIIAPIAIFVSEILSLWLNEYAKLKTTDILNSLSNRIVILINIFIAPVLLIFSTSLYLIIFRQNPIFYLVLIINYILIFLVFKNIRRAFDNISYQNLITSETFDALNIFTIFQFGICFFYRIDESSLRLEWILTYFIIYLCLTSVVVIKSNFRKELRIIVAIMLAIFFSIASYIIYLVDLTALNPLVLAIYITFVYYCTISLVQYKFEENLSLKESIKYLCYIGIFTAIIILLNFI